MVRQRKSGVLMHPTSLPGPGGIGSFGVEARDFVDFLQAAGQSLWQILPLGPTAYGDSPYSCYSAFAGNPLLISLDRIVEEGELTASEVQMPSLAERVDYGAVAAHKFPLLKKAAMRFFEAAPQERKQEFWNFCDSTFWLHDYALFMTLKEHFSGKSWNEWPEPILKREPAALSEWSEKLGRAIGEQKYEQWQFSRQWHDLKGYANSRGVQIVGDLPIFVAFDSADVWANPHLFYLDDEGNPTVVAGVPPDYFSETGQLWGNPLYNWERMAMEGYGWWIARIRNDLSLYDMVRIDHFRGFESYWEIPKGEPTAQKGRWVQGPKDALFDALHRAMGELPIIAEDLGLIPPEVEALRARCGFPGMKILQFAFGSGADNIYLPHNHVHDAVVYTGTHDNDTTAGWFESLQEKDRQDVLAYLDRPAQGIVWQLIRTALSSVADYCIIPMQDLLALPASCRMNVPGVAGGNWSWRCPPDAFSADLARSYRELTERYGRTTPRKEGEA
ncbi:4-alpha-glucanotransferase [Geomonas sp. RF6]|nr:4-alpha-glucanotransferase [Geomonas sp. RF6]